MKTFNTILATIATALLFAGCVNEEPNYKKTPEPEVQRGTGFLALNQMDLKVIFDDQTETHPDDTEDESQKSSSHAATRASELDAFVVEIFNSDKTSVLKKSYGELMAEFATNKVALPVGNYRMEVRSDDTLPDFAWEHPSYRGEQNFSILKNETTSIAEVVCTLANIKVTIMCSADLKARLNTDPTATKVSMSIGSVKASAGVEESRALYFRPQQTLNTLTFALDGQFSDGGKVKFTKDIANVKAGQWRKISLVIVHADQGKVGIDIQVENFVQDDEIHIDNSSGWREELLPETPVIDPTTPAITLKNHDLTTSFKLTEAMFDQAGNCTQPFAFEISATNKLSACVVKIGSSNDQFTAAISAMLGNATEFDLCTTGKNTPAGIGLKLFGFPVGSDIAGATAKSFDIAKMMPSLYEFDGTHTIDFTLTDEQFLTAKATLTVVVDKTAGTAPEVEWIDYDISLPQTLTDQMTVRVEVKATPGIKSLLVTIESVALLNLISMLGPEYTPLLSQFDLCTIDQEHPTAAEFLKTTVGFSVGADVKDQEFTFFDITAFVPVLKESIEPTVPGTPNHYKFHLEVIDNLNNSTKEVLHLVQPEVIAQ